MFRSFGPCGHVEIDIFADIRNRTLRAHAIHKRSAESKIAVMKSTPDVSTQNVYNDTYLQIYSKSTSEYTYIVS